MSRTWRDWARKPLNPYHGRHVDMTRENTARIIEAVLTTPMDELDELASDKRHPALVHIYAQAVMGAAKRQEYYTVDKMVDRVLGRASQRLEITGDAALVSQTGVVPPFDEFCIEAGYPEPFEKQDDMRRFAIEGGGARLLLGARGYGKTDYVVVLGMAYELLQNPTTTFLLVTKSEERNAAILTEIVRTLKARGVKFEKESSSGIRIEGHIGKDHSVSSITLGSASIRGRHPKRIIMDDPVTPEDVSEATRRKVQRVYNELTKLTQDIVVIGQPVHKFDLYETLRPLIAKMEVTHGEIPELDHDLEAQRAAGVSEESIQASYFLTVVSENGNPLENVQMIDDFPPGGSAVAFIDPSFEGGDFTALTILKSHFDGVAVHGRCWKRAWFNCVDEFCTELSDFGVVRLCFETNSLGEQPVVLLRDLLEGIGVVGRKSLGNKHARIMAVGPFSERIFLSRRSDRTYIDQTKKYEYGAKNDDGPDSLAGCLEWIGLIRGQKNRKGA